MLADEPALKSELSLPDSVALPEITEYSSDFRVPSYVSRVSAKFGGMTTALRFNDWRHHLEFLALNLPYACKPSEEEPYESVALASGELCTRSCGLVAVGPTNALDESAIFWSRSVGTL